MNAPTDHATLAAQDVTDVLEVSEVLDAEKKGGDGKASTAIAVLVYDTTEEKLKQLEQDYAGVEADTKTDEGLDALKTVVKSMVSIRTATEAAYSTWNKPVLALQKKARERKEIIIARVKAVEEPLQVQLDAAVAERNAIKNAAAVAESNRISSHVAALNALKDIPGNFVSASSADITAQLRELDSFEYLSRRDWQEYTLAATDALRTAIEALNVHLTNATAREQLAALLAQQEAAAQARRDEDAAREAARAAEEAERTRIRNIENQATACIGLTSEKIQGVIEKVERVSLDTFSDARRVEAKAAIDATLVTLTTLLVSAQRTEETAKQAAIDAAELAEHRAAKERQRREEAARAEAEVLAEQQRKEQAAREEAEAIERAAQLEREANELAVNQAAEARRREAQAAADAKARAEAIAQTLLDLLLEARAHVPAGELAERIDAALATAQGE